MHQSRQRRSALVRNFLLRRLIRQRTRRQTVQRSINHIQWTNAFVHVGSGYMAFGGIPRAPCLLPVQLVMNRIWNELQNENKLFSSIGLTPEEFWYLAGYYGNYRMAAGAIDNPAGRFRITSFGCLWPEFYLLCDFLKNYPTLFSLEKEYQLSKSSIAVLLPHALKVYLTMLSAMMMHTWPSVPAQTQAILSLHPTLSREHIFFLVDTSKTSNVDSTDIAVRAPHWNDNKGFGLVLSIFYLFFQVFNLIAYNI